MRYAYCRSLKEYLLRHVIQDGEVVSVTALAIRMGVERCHLWKLARELEREGLIEIQRPNRNGPLVLRPRTGRPLSSSDNLCYQLAYWPKGV